MTASINKNYSKTASFRLYTYVQYVSTILQHTSQTTLNSLKSYSILTHEEFVHYVHFEDQIVNHVFD